MEEFKKERTFHDAWAFILYVILTLTTSVTLVKISSGIPFDASIILPGLSVNVGIMLFMLTLIYLGFRYAADGLIFTVHVFVPIIVLIASILTENLTVIFISAALTCVSLLFYFWSIKPVLPLMTVSIQTGAKIISGNLFKCILLIMLSVFIIIFQGVVFTGVVGQGADGAVTLSVILFILNNTWTFFNIMYLVQTIVSGLVIGHLVDGEGSFAEASRNGLMALGSISFAGLVISIITTAKMIVQRNMDRNRESGSGNILNAIVLVILSSLETLINTANELAFPYLALHGTNYRDSMSGAFNLIQEKQGITLLTNIAMERVVMFCCIQFVCVLIYGDLLLFKALSIDKISDSMLTTIAAIGIPVIVFTYNFLSVFSSSTLALIYTYIESPLMVEKAEPEFAQAMESAK
ncbi:hypothetical protein HK407_01g00200 [Ordospora pajunii]|uniref:uncharacterized protein n=1 Tax=Ordospora pajunii TaxID=3039483 RepID=UPI0029528C35|nr:uncharacterized protein HK407_01g00200 [Ordospora pajunii]KAH9412129.1 hypothetical protein HK407_01g00200 [Ordospora pajunii]